MKISRYAIDRPRLVWIATLLVIFIAVFAALDIPVQRTPAITKAVILVAVPFPGAQPGDVEEQITHKIEDVLQSLSNVDTISSSSLRGSSITQIIFLDGVDPATARGEVKDLVDQVRRELPVGREIEPVVTEIDFDNTPLMLVNLSGSSDYDPRSLRKIGDEVEEELKTIPGIANVQVFGGLQREIHVNVDLDLASQYQLTLDDFRQSLSNYHAIMPAGSFNTGKIDFQVRNETKLRTLDDIRDIVIRHDQGLGIRLSDVADVQDTYRRLTNVAFMDGKTGVTLVVHKEADINTLATAKAVNKKLEILRGSYPDIEFSTINDSSAEISMMFRILGSSFVFGAMLVLIILAWSMGFRISILVLLAVPLSSAVGLIFLYSFKIPISDMVIFSFILSLGMVVDGAIIVAENIHRHIELGEDPVEAAKIGIEEVGIPVIVADITTICAFLPMLLVPGIMGDFLSVMPKVVSVSLFGSILVDHFLIPTLAAHWYRRRRPHQGKSDATRATANSSGLQTEKDSKLSTSSQTRPRLGPITRFYVLILNWSLDNRWAVVACTSLSIAWAFFMFQHVGFTFFPPSDRGRFDIKYELPLGSSIQQTIAAADVFTGPLLKLHHDKRHELVHFVTAIGSSEGLSSRLETDPAIGPEFGTIMVELKAPLDRDRHEDEIIRELRAEIDLRARHFPGLKYEFHEIEEGPPGGYDVAIRLTGNDLSLLGRTAKKISQRLQTIPGTVDAGNDYRDENPEVVVKANRWIVGLYDLNDRIISQTIQTAIQGDTSILMHLDDEDVALRLQAAPQYQRTRDELLRLNVTGFTGKKTTLGEVAELKREQGLYSINRYQRRRAVVVKCNVLASTRPDDVFQILREETLPQLGFRPTNTQKKAIKFVGKEGTAVAGLRATFTGENEERDKNFSYLLRSMTIAVILIFAILVMQFNSFRQATTVMLAVPLSFIGVIAGMWINQMPFSLATFIGLVSLTGIVVNDAIVVVDFINQARARGLATREAIVEAGINRLRPVFLTTITTIGGLWPLYANWSGGAEFWQPLTGAIIFGLSLATILTLLVIPVAYSLTYSFQKNT